MKAICLIVMTIASAISCKNNAIDSSTLQQGIWGGDHIRMEVATDRVSFEWDCAWGEITNPITVSNNQFSADGTYTRGLGGAIPVGVQPKVEPATYTGVLKGNTLEIQVVVKSTTQNVGTFQLEYGKESRLVKCL
ncbi:MAG: hypothetical protein U0Y10_14195 [Spirosomataceae bacterium]